MDIGDKVKKGDVLATLFVPELVEDFGTKKATVKLDEERIELARKMVEVAEADVKAAEASARRGQGDPGQVPGRGRPLGLGGQAARRTRSSGSVVDPQILLESTNQWKSSTAARDAAKATITKAEAELLSKQATLAKAKVDVAVAQADLAVATSEAKRIEAWVGYLTLTAPFDGVIVARNANTFDFVLPSTGDPTAMQRAPDLSPGGPPRRSTWSTAPTSSGSSSTSPSRTPTTSRSGRRRPCSPGRTATSRSRAPSRAPPGP